LSGDGKNANCLEAAQACHAERAFQFMVKSLVLFLILGKIVNVFVEVIKVTALLLKLLLQQTKLLKLLLLDKLVFRGSLTTGEGITRKKERKNMRLSRLNVTE
jgi:hypothetical protein